MHLSAIEAHRLWAPVYDAAPNPILALESRTLRSVLNGFTPRCVVDVACGTGRWARHFADGGATVFGVDACPEMLAKASRNPALHGRLALANAEDLPLRSGIADLTICSFAVSYFSVLPQALAEIARVTRAPGRIVISDMHPGTIAAGWTRSFKRNGETYHIIPYGYSTEQLCEAAISSGLHLSAQIDAKFGEPEKTIFERAGKSHLIKTLSTIPAVWVGVLEKVWC